MLDHNETSEKAGKWEMRKKSHKENEFFSASYLALDTFHVPVLLKAPQLLGNTALDFLVILNSCFYTVLVFPLRLVKFLASNQFFLQARHRLPAAGNQCLSWVFVVSAVSHSSTLQWLCIKLDCQKFYQISISIVLFLISITATSVYNKAYYLTWLSLLQGTLLDWNIKY